MLLTSELLLKPAAFIGGSSERLSKSIVSHRPFHVFLELDSGGVWRWQRASKALAIVGRTLAR